MITICNSKITYILLSKALGMGDQMVDRKRFQFRLCLNLFLGYTHEN